MDRPGDTAALLRFLIGEMDDELESGRASVTPPVLLRLDGVDVACAVGGIDLRVKPLDGHPAQVLRCFTAPPEWFAIGVLTGGWAHAPDAESVRVRVTSLMCRDGTELSAVRRSGEGLAFMEERGIGNVPDTLRRVLGLPTDPPDVTIAEWLAKCWLMVIAKQAKRGKRSPKLSWSEAAALHPALDAGEMAAMSWERFRQLHAERGSDEAAWMDDGMFARWQVHGYPPVAELLKRAARRLTPEARVEVETALTGWGLLDGASVA
ncbi:MAG: hypothetical protein QOG87_233 [Actinomycetota bacterium]